MTSKVIYLIFSLCLFSTTAQALELCGKPVQGELLQGKSSSISAIKFNDKTHLVSPNGEFLISIDRDAPKENTLTAILADGSKKTYSFSIKENKWDIQNLQGVPQRKVTPKKEDEAAINKERTLVRGAQKLKSDNIYWKSGFIQPVAGRISGKFGGQRIMNGSKMNPHMGLDIAAPEGTPLMAAGDGVVTLSAPSLFYSGNVIIINHGHGLYTIYAHMKSMSVKKGDLVKKGDIIGELGKTGRVTGAHLHWGASLNGTRFNPQSLLNVNNNDNLCFNL